MSKIVIYTSTSTSTPTRRVLNLEHVEFALAAANKDHTEHVEERQNEADGVENPANARAPSKKQHHKHSLENNPLDNITHQEKVVDCVAQIWVC